MAENVRLHFWVKLMCPRQNTQIVPKWHLAGQLAGPGFFNTRARCDAQKVSVFAGRESGWMRLAEQWRRTRTCNSRLSWCVPGDIPSEANGSFGVRLVRRPWLVRCNKYWPILCLMKYLGDGHYCQVLATHYARSKRKTKKSSLGKGHRLTYGGLPKVGIFCHSLLPSIVSRGNLEPMFIS